VTGHMTDAPGRSEPRFPESEVPRVQRLVRQLFDDWDFDWHDLLICGGARGGDLICAVEALHRGATVWVLLAHPAEEFEAISVAGSDSAWVEMFLDTLQRSASWDLSQLGEVPEGDEAYVRANQWMLASAEAQSTTGPPIILAIWDQRDAAGAGGSGDLVADARGRNAHIEVIDPRPS
jgi:hypothetical protein